MLRAFSWWIRARTIPITAHLATPIAAGHGDNGSGDDIGRQPVFDLGDQILEAQFAFLKPLQGQLIPGAAFDQRMRVQRVRQQHNRFRAALKTLRSARTFRMAAVVKDASATEASAEEEDGKEGIN